MPRLKIGLRKSCFQHKILKLTGSEDLADSVEVTQFALSAPHEVGGTDACMRVVLDGDLSTSVSYKEKMSAMRLSLLTLTFDHLIF